MVKLIGTAGHVDHGKTSLIRALTGIDADRLPEEKARGMTIDIGFAYVDLPGHGRVSIVDVPGHERFLSNMLVGAGAVRVGLLCVAADEGVKQQTREHFQILDLLPVERLVVALTRCDLADEDRKLLSHLEVESLLSPSRFQGCPVVNTSAETGEGLEELRSQLALALDAVRKDDSGLWYLPIDRVFSVKGHGCVVTGTLVRGPVKAGETAEIQPGGREVRIRGIQIHGESLDSAEPGRRVAVNLGGVDSDDLRRGLVLGAPGASFESDLIDVEMRWIAEPKHGLRIRVSIGTEEAFGRLSIARDGAGLAQIKLETKIACALGEPVIVRRYSPPDLLGGGLVRVPQATPRSRRAVPADADSAPRSPEDAILYRLRDREQGLPTEEICRALGRSPQELGTVFEGLLAGNRVLGFAGLWYAVGAFETARERFLAALGQLHQEHPTQGYQPRERVAKAAKLEWQGKPFDRIVAHLAQDGRLEASGTLVRRTDFQVTLTPRQRELLDRVIAQAEVEPVNIATHGEIANRLGVPIQAVDEIAKLGSQAGETVTVAPGLTYSRRQLEAIAGRLRSEFGASGFTPAQFRDLLQSSRKYVIPLLEYFDANKVTLRTGDQRFVR